MISLIGLVEQISASARRSLQEGQVKSLIISAKIYEYRFGLVLSMDLKAAILSTASASTPTAFSFTNKKEDDL